MNPQAARDLGINDGDYVYVDANPADRPYLGATPERSVLQGVAASCCASPTTRAYPYNVVMMKHGSFIATEKTVKAQQTRPDGLSLTEKRLHLNFRFGSQQSVTRNWHMPMHQTDTLFHKSKAFMSFIFGGEADNHAVNTVPKESLIRITKAEDGGLGGKGIWKPATTGMSPDTENDTMKKYLAGDFTQGESVMNAFEPCRSRSSRSTPTCILPRDAGEEWNRRFERLKPPKRFERSEAIERLERFELDADGGAEMPFKDPDPTDPNMLVGVMLPADADSDPRHGGCLRRGIHAHGLQPRAVALAVPESFLRRRPWRLPSARRARNSDHHR